MLHKWIPVGFGLVAILTLSTLSTATAAVGSLDAPIMISPAGQDAGDLQLVSSGTTITAVWAQFVGEYSTQIQASSSADGGTTWSSPNTISTAGFYVEHPVLVTDGTTITAAWNGTYSGASRIQAASSTDGGVTWSSPSVLPSTGIYDEIPRLVTDGTTITAVWRSLESTVINFSPISFVQTAFSSDGGLTWSNPTRLSLAGQFAYIPQIVTDGNTITVAWSRYGIPFHQIQVSSSTDGGDTWSNPVTLSDPGENWIIKQLVMNGSNITAVWNGNDGTAVSNNWMLAASSTDGGVTWSDPAAISNPAQHSYGVKVVSDGTTTTAVWMTPAYTLLAAYSVDGGETWSSPTTLSAGSQHDYEVELVTDGTTTTAVWVRLDGGFFHAPPNSPLYGGTYRTQAASSTNGGISWSSPATISSFTQPATETTANPPTRELQLVTDGATITAAWQRFDGSNTRIQITSYTPTTRIAGPDRFTTSAAVAQEFDSANTVYVANGRNYPDALSAAPAAAHANGPLLLTEQGSLPAVIAAEIVRLDPDRIVVVGGTGVVSLAVESALEALQPDIQVERIDGADRYETSREVTLDAFQAGAATAFIATGTNFPDALAASAAAGHYDGPVILTNGSATEIDTATLDLLDTLNTTEVLLAGGTGVVSTGIESSLKAVFGDPNVRRLAGANRYATSIAINTDTFTASPTVYLAVGTGYADALSGAALAGKNDAPLFVVPGTCVPQGVLDAIVDLGAKKVVLLGGTGVLNSSVANLVKCA